MMKSKTVRSFGRVFETSLGKVFGKALMCHVLCLIVLWVFVGCAEATAPHSSLKHIVSPNTKQTIAFFERSRSDWSNRLVTVEVGRKRCLLKKQPESTYIFLQNYTLETVPEQLAQEIEFDKLIIAPGDEDKVTQKDPRVLEKILSALGTIYADTLVFSDLDLDGLGGKSMIQRMARSVRRISSQRSSGRFGKSETPELAPPTTRCILSIRTLLIQHNTIPAINWLQKRVDLSRCRINLAIVGKLQLDNLEVLDGFNAERIKILTLKDFKKLGSLDCKLLREGPLPDKLTIWTTRPICPKISVQLARSILTKEWRLLVLPMQVWKELMKPGELPKHLTVAELTVYTPQHSMFTEFLNTSPPPMGDNLATVKVLIFEFYIRHGLSFSPSIVPIIDWISRYFRGLERLVIEDAPGETDFCLFLQKNQVVFTTNPGLKTIEVGKFKCSGYQSNKEPILCLSLEAWDLYRSGKLADELTRTQTDLSQLPAEQQAMLMSREELGDDSNACCKCPGTLADLRRRCPKTEIHILDHPNHSLCTGCLAGLIRSGREAGAINCPSCRKEHILPLVRNMIGKNNQGVFEVKRDTRALPVLSFPRPTPVKMLPRF
ncbi:hypothetical protein NEDG_01772 [Nematocida displodere]|uniref:Uncharacterized protein n=1 Tax=Nematocida displodere TaxID=1805483 RepID=A0A177EH41_9MICR|nr:hypothetical protein NEDG_01772 [Nematocida displodere]